MKRNHRTKSIVSLVLAVAVAAGTWVAGFGSKEVSAGAVPLFTGATYYTDTDNWGGKGVAITPADGDMDYSTNRIKNGDPLYPIEYKIVDVQQLPKVSAQLLVRAYDVDEYKNGAGGEWDRVYMSGNADDIKLGNPYTPWPTTGDWKNASDDYKKEFKQANYIGALSGQNEIWNTTVFPLLPEDFSKIATGDNFVGTSIHHYYLAPTNTFNDGWVTEIDWAQLVIDGGTRENGEFTDAGLTVQNGKITLDTTFVPNNTGNYVVEANVIQKVKDVNGNVQDLNLDVESKSFTNAAQNAGKDWDPVLTNSSIVPGTEYFVNVILFDARSDGTPGKAEHVLSFSTYNMKAHDIDKTVLQNTDLPLSSADFQSSFFKNSGVGGAGDITNGENLQVVTIRSLPDAADGKLIFNGQELTAANLGPNGYSIGVADLGKLKYQPAPTMDADATFAWTGYGQGKNTVNSANVNLHLNYAPTVEHITKLTDKGSPVSFTSADFTGNAFHDNNSEPLVKAKIVSLPDASKGKLALVSGSSSSDVVAGQELTPAELDTLQFIPEPNAEGGAEFWWNGSDGQQYALENKKVSISINTPPAVADIAKTGLMGETLDFASAGGNSFASAYSDADNDPMQGIQVTLPENFDHIGKLYYTGTSVEEAVYAPQGATTPIPAAALGSLKFTPASDLENGATVRFGWSGYDGKHYSKVPAQVTISYNGIPAASPLVTELQENANAKPITLSGTDSGANIGELAYSIVQGTGPSKGALSPANPEQPHAKDWLYTPEADTAGIDTFSYTVTDQQGQTSSPATVKLNILKALDGWVGNKSQGDTTDVTAIPGQPLKLSAVSALTANKVFADVNGNKVELIWINTTTSVADGYKQWALTNTPLDDKTETGTYKVTFSAEDAQGEQLPGEDRSRLADNNFKVLEVKFALFASPEQILADGQSTSELSAVLKDADNQPISGVKVEFSADKGSFPDGAEAVTDSSGIAKVIYQSSALTGTDPLSVPVTATVLDLDKGLSADAKVQLTFLPAQVKGVITSGDSNAPVPGATVRVTLDIDGDGIIDPQVDFDKTVITDEHGAYALPVPKGGQTYSLTITQTVNIGGIPTPITYNQTATVGAVHGNGDETFESDKTITGIVGFKQPNGLAAPLISEMQGKTFIYLKDASGAYVQENGVAKAFPVSGQGVFNANRLAVGDYTLEVRYAIEPGKEITISQGTVSLKANGELNITQQLIDPYGVVTDAGTNQPVEGAKVTLLYAQTARNTAAGKTGGTPVHLPALTGFAPNDNASPEQSTDAAGNYAYMVYPETDYYLVVSKPGYQTYISPVIAVNQDIVKHDIKLARDTGGTVPGPALALTVSTPQNVVKEGGESTFTVDYKNLSSATLTNGTVTITLPAEAQVTDAGGGKVNGNTIAWNVTNLTGGQTGSLKFTVKWAQLSESEKELSVRGDFTAAGATGISAASTAKIKIFSDRFGALNHQRYILGMPDGEFKLNASLTRAELAAIVARLTDNQMQDGTLSFTDVRQGHWATNYIMIAVKHGYFSGFADGTFKPDQPVTRGELAAVMARFLQLKPGVPVQNHFSDSDGHWAENAIEALYSGNFLSGYSDGSFRPGQKIARAEAVTMINRMLFRGPLQGMAPVFPDVPSNHWAFGDVQEATVSHVAARNADGSETFVKQTADDVK